MTITASLTLKGSIGLRARGARSRARLRELQYVHSRNGRGVAWWPYAQDLRRDIGDLLQWAPGSRERLRAVLVREVVRSRLGDDQEALAVFNGGMRPYGYQLQGIHFAVNTERILLADDVGTGKTIQTLGALGVLKARGDVQRALIVVPSGLRYQWWNEAQEFLRPDIIPKCTVVSGTKAQRRRLYATDWEILITGHDLVRNDEDILKPLRKSIQFVALDEASVIRNEEATISIVMKRLFRHVRFRLALTATPVENKLADLRSVFAFVDPRVFPSRDFFNARYVEWQKRMVKVRRKNGGRFWLKTLSPKGYKNLPEVRHKIRSVYIRRRVRDVGIELPDIVIQNIRLKLPKLQREVYESIKIATFEDAHGLRGAALVAPLQALRQACNTTELVSKRGKRVSVKLKYIKELLDTELAGEQVLIFTDYERWVRLLKRDLSGHGVVTYTGKMEKRGRNNAIAKFKNGDARVLIGTMALERGHNLQMASVVINADLPYNPARLIQRIGRVRRIGSKNSTTRMINLIAEDTVEEHLVLDKLYRKGKLFSRLFSDNDLFTESFMDSLSGSKISQYL